MTSTSEHAVHDRTSTSGGRRAAGYARTAVLALAALGVATATSQAHHHYAPADAGGWRELPIYAVSAVLAYGIVCLVLLRAHRSERPSTTGVLALGLGVLSVLALVVYWTALPLTWGGTAVLLAAEAGSGRLPVAARVAGAAAVLGVVVLLGYRLAGGTANLGG